MTRGEIAVLAGSAVAVGVTAWWAITYSFAFDAELSWHGVAALVLGVGVSLALGVGLMRLAYRSHRTGHDEAAHHADRDADLPPRP